jgi:hypothetical protein
MDANKELELFQCLGRLEEGIKELQGPKGRISMLEAKAEKNEKLVEKHERIVVFGGWMSLPMLGLIHLGLKHIFSKLGI